jgi:hypothetical protein
VLAGAFRACTTTRSFGSMASRFGGHTHSSSGEVDDPRLQCSRWAGG